MSLPANDPFACADELLAEIPTPRGSHPIVLVDAHMEATAEKAALAHHLDGRVTAVLGTHTHIPTADARVLPGGTAFQTDVGMCGPYDSIIGRDPIPVLRHMRTSVHTPYEMARGGERISGAVIEVNLKTSLARSIQPFVRPEFRSRMLS
jgi:calcineurin-like phosphoesterase